MRLTRKQMLINLTWTVSTNGQDENTDLICSRPLSPILGTKPSSSSFGVKFVVLTSDLHLFWNHFSQTLSPIRVSTSSLHAPSRIRFAILISFFSFPWQYSLQLPTSIILCMLQFLYIMCRMKIYCCNLKRPIRLRGLLQAYLIIWQSGTLRKAFHAFSLGFLLCMLPTEHCFRLPVVWNHSSQNHL